MSNENNIKEEVKDIFHRIQEFGMSYSMSISDIQDLLLKLTKLVLKAE